MNGQNQTRTGATNRAYIRRAKTLSKQAATELGLDCEYASLITLVTWFQGSNARWRPSTTRQYRAAITYTLEKFRLNPELHDEASAALARLNAEPTQPLPCPPTIRRTSAKKRKAMSPDEMLAIATVLRRSKHPYSPIALRMLWLGVELGLRPHEWATARLEGTILVVTNAKRTNGRANGEVRNLELSGLAPGLAKMAVALLEMIATALKTAPWVQVAAGVRYLFAWASAEAVQVEPSLRGARISPYTGRHVCAARAKGTMDEVEVATLLGHVSTRTARHHYARQRSSKAWRPMKVMVDPTQTATVRLTYRPRAAKPAPDSPEPPTI